VDVDDDVDDDDDDDDDDMDFDPPSWWSSFPAKPASHSKGRTPNGNGAVEK